MTGFFSRFCITGICFLSAALAHAQTQTAAPTPDAPKPAFAVYQGKILNLRLADVISQINALPPIAYIDPQITNDFTTKPVLDVEKIAVTPAGGHIEFWSNDSRDGMAMESEADVQWTQVCCGNVYVVNDPAHEVNNQVEAVNPGGSFIIKNAFRNVDDAGHLAALQQGEPDNMIAFDNEGDLGKAEHIADLLTTLINLSASAPATPALTDSGQAAPNVAVTPYVHPAGSYFEGPFAIRYTPQQDGTASVNVINVSSKTVGVSVSVTKCENITGGDCGTKFAGKLAPGMSVNFPVAGNDMSQPWDFHIDTAQQGA